MVGTDSGTMGSVSVISDLGAAAKVVRNAVRSRRNRRRIEQYMLEHEQPAAGSVRIAVYFADTRVNLYQIRQWYAPLAELSRTHPVVIITRSPGASLTMVEESPVPVIYKRRITDLEQFV